MSYSFSVQATDRAAAKVKVKEELDKVKVGQPNHTELEHVEIAANAFIDALKDRTHLPDQDVYVSVSGSVWTDSDPGLISVGTSISAGHVTRKA